MLIQNTFNNLALNNYKKLDPHPSKMLIVKKEFDILIYKLNDHSLNQFMSNIIKILFLLISIS